MLKETIKDIENAPKNKTGLNTVLADSTRKIYKEKELCPYCHCKNSKCGFLSGVSNKDVYVPEEKDDSYKKQDKEGRKFLKKLKDELKGEKFSKGRYIKNS